MMTIRVIDYLSAFLIICVCLSVISSTELQNSMSRHPSDTYTFVEKLSVY